MLLDISLLDLLQMPLVGDFLSFILQLNLLGWLPEPAKEVVEQILNALIQLVSV